MGYFIYKIMLAIAIIVIGVVVGMAIKYTK